MTDAVVASVADFGFASPVAEPAVGSGFDRIVVARVPAAVVFAAVFGLVAVVAERAVAVAFGPDLTFVERGLVAVPVFDLASVLAERDVAAVSGLALIFFAPVLAFALVAFPPAHRLLC